MKRQRILVVAVLGVGAGLAGCFHADGSGGPGQPRDAKMAPAGVELADWRQRCRTNMDCDANYRCIVPAGASIRNGVCGVVVDQEGVRLTSRARAVPGCEVRQDCPLPFSCLKVSTLDGLCVK